MQPVNAIHGNINGSVFNTLESLLLALKEGRARDAELRITHSMIQTDSFSVFTVEASAFFLGFGYRCAVTVEGYSTKVYGESEIESSSIAEFADAVKSNKFLCFSAKSP